MSGARGKLIVYMCSLIESRNYAAENHCEQIKKIYRDHVRESQTVLP